ncbi:MAG: DUF1800 domain-containing protein [Wenzhouxiangella sp.]|jgi:uncharacterized protein (DUF1800 family)|nr:DUF1800 domain-containing protein [Wenzhouxiangella sp.]
MDARSNPLADRGDDRIFGDAFRATQQSPGPLARRALERFSYGATPQSLAEFEALGPDDPARLVAWVDQQLAPQAIDDSACSSLIAAAGYTTLDKSLAQLWADHVRGSANRYRPLDEAEAARLVRGHCSRRQVFEMMVEFWHDHFNVFGRDFSVAPVFPHYDRDVIRPNALGNFRTMIEQVARSTAMLYYLDNRSSRGSSFNENYARELLELHTMGAEVYYPTVDPHEVPPGEDGLPAGYSDWDVYDAARCFTGWTVRDGNGQFPRTPDYDTGEFLYWADWHDANSGKYFLGQFILPNGPALGDGRLVLDRLCIHPATARHVCRKLIRRFVADDPPASLVESAAAVFRTHWQTPDQIARVLRHILLAPEALQPGSVKVRRPWEMLMAALRKTDSMAVPQPGSGWQPWGFLMNRLEQTGHRPFRWPPPDGYPDTADRWTSVSVMGQTWRLMSVLPELREGGEYVLPIVSLTLQAFPIQSQRTAAAIVDWWLNRLVGSEVNPARRVQLIDFLRQNAAADEPLDLERSPPHGSWSANDLKNHYVLARLRATFGLMCSLPEFHRRR